MKSAYLWIGYIIFGVSLLVVGCVGSSNGPGLSDWQLVTVPSGGTMQVPPGMMVTADSEIVPIPAVHKVREMPTIVFVIGAVAIVAGVAVGYLLKQIALGILISMGGAVVFGITQFLDTYAWALWIPFGILVAAGGLLLVQFVQIRIAAMKAQAQAADSQATLDVIVPAIESQPSDVSKKVKASIGNLAGVLGASNIVKKEVTASKERVVSIPKEENING